MKPEWVLLGATPKPHRLDAIMTNPYTRPFSYPIVVEEEEDKMSQLQQANFLQEFSTALCATAHHHEFDDIHSPLLTRSPPNLPLPNSTILPHQPTANSQLPKWYVPRPFSGGLRGAKDAGAASAQPRLLG